MRSIHLFCLTAGMLSMAGASSSLAGPVDPDVQLPVRVANIEEASQRLNGWLAPGHSPSMVVSRPGATFLRLHFSTAYIPDGAWVELTNASGEVVDRFDADDVASGSTGEGYYAASVEGDTTTVTMRHDGSNAGRAFSLVVDSVDVGFASITSRAVIGADQRERPACVLATDATMYRRSQAVARVYGFGYVGTAWRVGAENRMLTNHHVIGNHQNPADFELWFGHEHAVCGGSNATTAGTKVRGGERLVGDAGRDFQLFALNAQEFSSGKVARYGYLGLDVTPLAVGQPIYIPQHGGGRPKQIARMDDAGRSCSIASSAGNMRRYACDTEGGSSGSPVIDRQSHRARVLHNSSDGGLNQGNAIEVIWPSIRPYFANGQVPSSSQ
ncbi:serine protease [Pinirhizobacter sp.]|jgi:V8-like Glu-specific endopeptidase|uniref:trypsin-like serine peptidase n=1 Tax=Pinirhizobacter sp. TaxID=2950432 RepID=UPI002F42E4A5